MIEIRNAAVLPVPVCARPMASLPARVKPSTWAWIGVQYGKPRSWMACISSGASLKSWKRVLPSWGSTTKSSSFHGMTGALGFGSRRRFGGFRRFAGGCFERRSPRLDGSRCASGSCFGAATAVVGLADYRRCGGWGRETERWGLARAAQSRFYRKHFLECFEHGHLINWLRNVRRPV